MKIGIITHSLRYNYGGILQNYALQQVLKQLGHTPVTIKILRQFPVKPILYVKYIVKGLLKMDRVSPMTKCKMDAICLNTDTFINAHIAMSPPMETINKRWVIEQNFDAFIVGSDQVLHAGSYPRIEDIYLSFVENDCKITYAASFGSENWMYQKREEVKCAEHIMKFKAVSVRENSGLAFMKDKYRVDATLVLDPTLLLKASDYRKLFSNSITNDSVVTYLLDPTKEKAKFISECSDILGKKVLCAGNEIMDNPNAEVKDRVAPSVENWLDKISNADFIITDSYHGTLFSIIFQKNFITIGNKKRGMDRFYTILNLLHLSDRLVTDTSHYCESMFTTPIDYNRVNGSLNEYLKKSMMFLNNNLLTR